MTSGKMNHGPNIEEKYHILSFKYAISNYLSHRNYGYNVVHEAGRINIRINIENWSKKNSHSYSRAEGNEIMRKGRIKDSYNESPRPVFGQSVGRNERANISIDEQAMSYCARKVSAVFYLSLDP